MHEKLYGAFPYFSALFACNSLLENGIRAVSYQQKTNNS